MPVNGMEMKVAKNDDAEPGRVPAITAMITARILFQLNFALRGILLKAFLSVM